MTLQAKLKFLLEELAREPDTGVAVRRQKNAYYATVYSVGRDIDHLVERLFLDAYVTSSGFSGQTYRLPDLEILEQAVAGMEIDPTWLTWNDRTVVRIAENIRAGRAFEQLPILADALEESGCATAQLLSHARSNLRHYHRCWLVEWLLACAAGKR